ncbi:helix-turn-helix domain-containing protein [Vibrio mediterranei]|uniref:helix-turn-helix domain-containing protein n=1 Tax=Vibrio mediterranei TaxID=689 RepID=UPI001EFE2EC9|nr:helix-turn-helix transcriptional regulator [Vibrio mediterranei]MCG9628586.1 helix-turn-helix domain-containing protein [Vibrio mediterranei]
MNVGKKIKAIRIAEGLSQPKMAQLIDMPIGTLRNCEQDRTELKIETLMKITKHERFKKYAFWLTTNEVLPESGQISPDYSILLELGIVDVEDSPKRA